MPQRKRGSHYKIIDQGLKTDPETMRFGKATRSVMTAGDLLSEAAQLLSTEEREMVGEELEEATKLIGVVAHTLLERWLA